MKISRTSSVFGSLLAAMFLILRTDAIRAQQAKMVLARSSVTILRVEKLPNNAGAVLVRQAGAQDSYVLVDGNTTPADLERAMSGLILSLKNKPNAPQREMRAIIAHATPEGAQATASRSDNKRAASDLKRLAQSGDPDLIVPGVGRGKAITVKVKLN